MKQKYFDLAVRLARLSTHPRTRVGAVIVRRGVVLGVGCNLYRTHPRSTTPHRRIHAELKAVLNAGCDITDSDVYTVRLTKRGDLACAFPCPACESLLREGAVRNVYSINERGQSCLHKTLS